MSGAASHNWCLRAPLTTEYEQIRRRVLCRPFAEQGAGYGLILRRGMLIWMRMAAPYALDTTPAPAQRPTSQEPFASAVEAELVHVLAALLLSGYAGTCVPSEPN
jgi:hypothetical protein